LGLGKRRVISKSIVFNEDILGQILERSTVQQVLGLLTGSSGDGKKSKKSSF